MTAFSIIESKPMVFEIQSAKYGTFNNGDLIQIEHGIRPVGIICGEPKQRYGDGHRVRYQFDEYGNEEFVKYMLQSQVNYIEYPVLLTDLEEARANDRWYWPGGLNSNNERWDALSQKWIQTPKHDPLIAYIHPKYLTLLSKA